MGAHDQSAGALSVRRQDRSGNAGLLSPPWYRERGAVYLVTLAEPLTEKDVEEINKIGRFVNRSFIIFMAAILEQHGVVPQMKKPDRSKYGGDHAQLTIWLRQRFAHGKSEYDANDPWRVETRDLLPKLFPKECAKEPGFPVSIDKILEPLKEGVLGYIRAATQKL